MDKQKYEQVIENLQCLLRAGNSLSVGWSGGKDSTVCLILTIEAIARMNASGEHVPRCYVQSVNTKIEMPAMEQYLAGALVNLEVFVARTGLPIEVIEIVPPLSGRFTWTTLGRGKLPRYPGQSRDCARDMKINPQRKVVKRIQKETGDNVIAIIGSREDESVARKKSMQSYKMDESNLSLVDGLRTYAPIAHFDIDDVWELLVSVTQNQNGEARYFKTFQPNFDEMMRLYRDANEGVCGVIIGDNGNKAACGSRFGCAFCPASGEKDKSLESLLEESEYYSFMEGFVRFSQFLFAIRWDMNRRDFRGRTVVEGHMKVTPDYFNAETKRELYRYLLTLDKLEQERAASYEQMWHNGEVEHTEENRLLCGPMFQFITYSDVVAIDFQWSLCRDWTNEASPAAKDWLEVHEMGRRYHIPSIPKAPRVTIPKPRWFNVEPYLKKVGDDVLFGQLPHRKGLVEFQTSKELQVGFGAGFEYIETVRNHYYDLHRVSTEEVARIILHRGYLILNSSDVKKYESIARRNEALNILMREQRPIKVDPISGDDQLQTIHEYLMEHSISNEEHQKIVLSRERESLAADEQIDFFGVDSVIEMIAVQAKEVTSKTTLVESESIHFYRPLGQQVNLF